MSSDRQVVARWLRNGGEQPAPVYWMIRDASWLRLRNALELLPEEQRTPAQIRRINEVIAEMKTHDRIR